MQDLLRRPAPPRRDRSRHHPRPPHCLPGRADQRPRPAESRPHVGRDPSAARRGDDRLHHHALPGRGRRALRPDRDHGPRRGGRRGYAGRAEAGDLRRGAARRAGRRRHPAGRPTARHRAVRHQAGNRRRRRPAPDRRRGGHRHPAGPAPARPVRPQAQLDRAAPPQPRRRLPHQDRPLAARVLTTRSPIMKFARDTWLVAQRQMQLLLRNPVWVFVGVFQPVMYLLLFAPLLKPALNAPTQAEAYKIFVPGLLVLLAIFGGLFQGFGLIAELRAGVIERSRVTPVSRLALLLGRALRDVVSLLAQAVIITLLALLFELRVFIGDLLLAYLMLALIALMTSAVSYGVALKVKSEDALAPVMNTVAQPVLLLSGILLPLTFAPGWLQRIAEWNPFSWAVDGTRALFAGDLGNDKVWQGLTIIAVLAAVGVAWAARQFARSVR
ncbi:daunorubicin resistance ABC transporter ATPase subunit [Micromonospora sp. ATCC 39149]|nr:daunorubicin resistance ABC transporter ATPase subunit [Micromonospora sp. ATCC 39149]